MDPTTLDDTILDAIRRYPGDEPKPVTEQWLAHQAGTSRRQVRYSLERLQDDERIAAEKHTTPQGFRAATRYTIMED